MRMIILLAMAGVFGLSAPQPLATTASAPTALAVQRGKLDVCRRRTFRRRSRAVRLGRPRVRKLDRRSVCSTVVFPHRTVAKAAVV